LGEPAAFTAEIGRRLYEALDLPHVFLVGGFMSINKKLIDVFVFQTVLAVVIGRHCGLPAVEPHVVSHQTVRPAA
jgi:hypothetical protein